MFHKIKEVKPLKNFKLLIIFADNTTKIYNVEPLFDKWKVFNDLKTIPNLFQQVKVDIGGYGISWNDNIDLSCNELWYNGIEKDMS